MIASRSCRLNAASICFNVSSVICMLRIGFLGKDVAAASGFQVINRSRRLDVSKLPKQDRKPKAALIYWPDRKIYRFVSEMLLENLRLLLVLEKVFCPEIDQQYLAMTLDSCPWFWQLAWILPGWRPSINEGSHIISK